MSVLFIAVEFTDPTLAKMLQQWAGDRFGEYRQAMLEGFGSGLFPVSQQLRQALSNEVSDQRLERVATGCKVCLGERGWSQVLLYVFPADDRPDPAFCLGPDANDQDAARHFKLHSYLGFLGSARELPPPHVVCAWCKTQACQLGWRLARDGFPKPIKRAIAAVGSSLRYLDPATEPERDTAGSVSPWQAIVFPDRVEAPPREAASAAATVAEEVGHELCILLTDEEINLLDDTDAGAPAQGGSAIAPEVWRKLKHLQQVDLLDSIDWIDIDDD